MIRVMRSLRQKETLLQIGLCALVFVGMAVPFKVMVLVEGFTEVRPVNAVPVVVGLLLGPAGAWGCAIGNLIADLFGTFSKASFLGFWGNFLAAYLPYQIWHTLKPGERPNVKSSLNLLIYLGLSAISSLTVAIFLTSGLEAWLGLWLPNLFFIIFFNNLGFPLALGLPVFIVLTSDAHNIQPVLPRRRTGRELLRLRVVLAVLVLVEVVLGLMIARGVPLSASVYLYCLGCIFLVCLIGFVLG